MPPFARVPDALRGRPFRGSDAVRSGVVTRRPLRAGVWRRLFHSRRMAGRQGGHVRYADLRASDAVRVGGVPATSPVRTAFDLARSRELPEAVVAVDALLHVRDLRLDAIAAYARDGRERWPGHAGCPPSWPWRRRAPSRRWRRGSASC